MFSKPGFGKANDTMPRKDFRTTPGPGTTTQPQAPQPPVDLTTPAAMQATAGAASPAVAPPPPAAAPASSEARLVVGPDVKLKGAEILDCDTLVVEGRVEATMDSRVIRIAEHGSYTGKVSIDVAEIHGSFDGELSARSQLTIHATGRVSGKIRYGKLVIDEGGELCGDIDTLREQPPLHKARSEATPALAAVGS